MTDADAAGQPVSWPTSMIDLAADVQQVSPNRTMEQVGARLLEIEREKHGYRDPDTRPRLRTVQRIARPPDGVACFNFMYLRVTEEVHRRAAEFKDPPSLRRLAIVFADFYLRAYDAATAHQWISKAWAPLIEERENPGILPMQFALAGMNAHINNDLTWALMQVWDEAGGEPGRDSPQWEDFLAVNRLLAGVQDEVRGALERGYLRWLN